MADFCWVIACQRAIVDQGNNMSLVQIVEDIGLPPPPGEGPSPIGSMVPFPISVVTYWRRSEKTGPEKVRVRFRMLGPEGKQFGSSEFDVNLLDFPRAQCITEIPGISYHGPGRYTVRVEAAYGKGWRKVGQTEFNVHHNVPMPKIAKMN